MDLIKPNSVGDIHKGGAPTPRTTSISEKNHFWSGADSDQASRGFAGGERGARGTPLPRDGRRRGRRVAPALLGGLGWAAEEELNSKVVKFSPQTRCEELPVGVQRLRTNPKDETSTPA